MPNCHCRFELLGCAECLQPIRDPELGIPRYRYSHGGLFVGMVKKSDSAGKKNFFTGCSMDVKNIQLNLRDCGYPLVI